MIPQRVLLFNPYLTSTEMVSVNRQRRIYQVTFIPVLLKISGDALEKVEECSLFKGGIKV